MSKTVVHMIGQAHLDPVWLWRWTEGRAEALATSQSAVDRLAEYPDFHFTRGESQIYRWIEQENPALFAEIRDLIRQGRWHVVNGMVIQPDMNVPGGESFVRQVLLGKAYMRQHLGVEPRVAYCVDSFGHAGTLPQILAKCGFDAYVFMRPGPHEKELPSQAFWWQGPDGSRVLAFRIAASYGTRNMDHAEHIAKAVAAKPPQLDQTMCFFGVGNHGGGPTKQQIENIQAIARNRDDLEIRFSSTDAYFAAIAPAADTLPTVAEELQFHAVGCYSVNSALKRSHRQAECGLLLAERLASMAQAWVGQPAPAERLRALWHDLCFNQFHDTLGGSSTKEAEDEAIMSLGRVIMGSREIADDAGRAIAARVNTAGAGGTVVLFNPSAEPVSEYVEYEPWTEWQLWAPNGWGLTDEAGPRGAASAHRDARGADSGDLRHQPARFPGRAAGIGLSGLPLCARTAPRSSSRSARPRRRRPAWRMTCSPSGSIRRRATSSRASTRRAGWSWSGRAAGTWRRCSMTPATPGRTVWRASIRSSARSAMRRSPSTSAGRWKRRCWSSGVTRATSGSSRSSCATAIRRS